MARNLDNPFRELLERRAVLYGALIGVPTPRLVEMCGYAGFDWVMVDGEHDMVDLRACYDLATAADAVGLAFLARVPANRPELIQGFADAGAHAVLVPHVASAEAARRVVSSLRFPPLGRRGIHSGTRAAKYGLVQPGPAYFAGVHNQALAAVMIEELEAVASLDEIASVAGLDLFFVGAGDLAGALGMPGQPDHPRVREVVADVAHRLRQRDRTVAMVASTPASAEQCVSLGARLVMVPTGHLFGTALAGYVNAARDLCE